MDVSVRQVCDTIYNWLDASPDITKSAKVVELC